MPFPARLDVSGASPQSPPLVVNQIETTPMGPDKQQKRGPASPPDPLLLAFT
jgi:hypothetical protein